MPLWQQASSSCQVFRPVRMLARQGLHLGFEVKACLNRMPSRAMRSKFGVLTQVQPYAPAWFQFQSSKMTNRILGRWAGWAASSRGPLTSTARSDKRVQVLIGALQGLDGYLDTGNSAWFKGK